MAAAVPPLIATLEAGGTKMIAGLASGPGSILLRKQIPTTSPEETLDTLIDFFSKAARAYPAPGALAVGSFGPVDLDRSSPTFGQLTDTPKPGWAGTNLLSSLQRTLGVPSVIETDVNASLYGESRWGAAKRCLSSAYLTVGTGIGGGLMLEGRLVHGTGHPEMGHMMVRPHEEDRFTGCCPFHGRCLEGLASGPALEKRWKVPAAELPPGHIAWTYQADYLAQACLNLLMIAPPERIILGGGVMHQSHLFPMIRRRLKELLHSYLPYPQLREDLTEFIVPPSLGADSALLGCVALGQDFLRSGKGRPLN